MSPQRWTAFIIAGIAVLLFSLQIDSNKWTVALAGVGLYLGITDYGRQCPLWFFSPPYDCPHAKKGLMLS